MLDHMRRFVELADIAVRIRNCETDWDTKYAAIFSSDIADAIGATGHMPDYADPDGDYEDDVIAFVAAVEHEASRIRPILAALGS